MWWPPRLGEPLPRGAEAVGVHHKLETYSLVLDHERGGDKALVFERALGVTHREVDYLATETEASESTTSVSYPSRPAGSCATLAIGLDS
jgi:hypothetical protein